MKTKFPFLIPLIFFGLVLVSTVFAQLGIPHQFWGTVTYNDAPAPDGVSIIAKIDNVIVKESTTLNGKYGYDPLFIITDSNENRNGKIIVFYVNNVEAATHVFENGRATGLNLNATGSSLNPPSSGGGGGGSGGGGGGGGSGGGGSSSGEANDEENPDNTIIQDTNPVEETNNENTESNTEDNSDNQGSNSDSSGFFGLTGFSIKDIINNLGTPVSVLIGVSLLSLVSYGAYFFFFKP